MATQAQHIAARNDGDLLARFIAAAELAGIPNAQAWAETRRGALVSQPVQDGKAVADVHAYAVASYGGRPGQDATKVTDEHVAQAVQAVHAAE